MTGEPQAGMTAEPQVGVTREAQVGVTGEAQAGVTGEPPPGESALLPASFLQRGLWPRLRGGAPGTGYTVRAVRFTGDVVADRLREAVRSVQAELPSLGMRLVEQDGRLGLRRCAIAPCADHDLGALEPAARDAACVALLRADRDRGSRADEPGTRFSLIRLADDEWVLGLVAHELILDDRSLYLVLGAVLQAYQDRFRGTGYKDAADMLDYHPLTDTAIAARRTWWTKWLAECPDAPANAPARRDVSTVRLEIAGPQWRTLASSGGALRDNGSLGVAALVAWWLRGVRGPAAPALATVLDLRDYFDLGRVVGPLTDRTVFRVEPPAEAAPSYRAVYRRAQAGILKAATHYLPYGDLVELGVASGRISRPRTAALWDVDVHLCADPPSSGRSRGTENGIEAELFCEAELLGTGTSTGTSAGPDQDWDGTNVDVRLGERHGGVTLVADVNQGPAADRLMDGLAALIAAAAADPEAPLPRPEATK
ncbi:hypothetical protein ABIA35_001283 [Catenulispora sp. MAP12-49]|uniref:condensation domain-containing protein n=1 Tax=Catenulispora sp. MAP12-49 TaxID=3156302 RepID=UPI00351582A4